VVDDEPMIGKSIQRALRSEHEVVYLDNAAAACALLRSGERFDLIISDLMMPQMTGMELYEAIVAIDPRQAERVVFLTGGAFTPGARDFMDRVPNRRIEKPFETQALRSLIRREIAAPSAAKKG
jgi:CheY-like chemotaxis protein